MADEKRSINSIVLNEGQATEYDYILKEHVGKDRSKDAQVMAFISEFESFETESQIMKYVATNPDFLNIADVALDLDDPWNKKAPELGWAETFMQFMKAIEFRTSALRRDDVQEAIAK